MIPRDAESETQWQVTWFPPDRADVTRTGTEAQVRKTARLQEAWNPIIEKREIVVGGWEVVENKAIGIVEEVPCSHPGWTHIGSQRFCAACGVDRDDLEEPSE